MNIIEELIHLVSAKFNEMKSISLLMQLESKLAAQSILPFMLSVFMIFIVLISTWFSCLTLMTYCAFLVMNNLLYALLFTFLVNACLLYAVFRYLKYNVHNMSFEKTRHYFLRKETHHDLEKKLNRSDRDGRKKITSSAV